MADVVYGATNYRIDSRIVKALTLKDEPMALTFFHRLTADSSSGWTLCPQVCERCVSHGSILIFPRLLWPARLEDIQATVWER
jgi:hypothetical protein